MISCLRMLFRAVAATVVALSLALGSTNVRAAAQGDPPLPVMKPGKFVWYEEPALVNASLGSAESVALIISIAEQQAYVVRDGRLIAITSVSTGARGHETPTGEFDILQKKAFHRSNLYSNAPMPFMQRLTWSGIALHGGHLPGYPASHGCIRLPQAFARQLFDLTRLGGRVRIVDALPEVPGLRVPGPPPPPLLVAETRSLTGNRVAARVVDAPAAPPTPVPVEVADLESLLAEPDAARPARGRIERAAPVGAMRSGPALMAETRNLGGGAYDLVTLSGPPPAEMLQPVSASYGTRRNRVQPIRKGGR